MSRDLLEQSVIVQDALARRREEDSLWAWTPTARQRPFVEAVLAKRVRESWLITANRFGKTDAACYCGAVLSRFGWDNPFYGTGKTFRPMKGWVVSATSNASRTVIQPKYFDNGMGELESHRPFIPEREIASWNINEQTLKLKNGSVIEFKTAEAKTISFAGAAPDWIQIDEELEQTKYNELAIRVGGGKRLAMFGACTLLPPEGQAGGVSWMFDAKIKPWIASGGTESSQPAVWDQPYLLFGGSIYDNPNLLPEEIGILESLYPVGSAERQIRLDGQWLPGIQGSRAYTSFDYRLHVREQPAPQPRAPLCWTWDFNVEPMISLVGQREGNIFRFLKEFVIQTDASIDAMVDFFLAAYPSHHGELWIFGDASGRKRNTLGVDGRSEYQAILNRLRTYGSPVRLKVPEANPIIGNRINAVNNAMKDEAGMINVEIDPSCKELIVDLETVLRDNRGGIKKVSDRKNPYFYRTHASDAAGYWITHAAPVRSANRLQRAVQHVASKLKAPSYGQRP